MELIKQIKEAEKQAQEIVEKAKRESASLSDEAQRQRDELLKQSQQRRIEAIEDALNKAEKEGKAQADQIAQAGAEAVSSLKASCSPKIQSCVEKILSRLQQVE
jgi:V/A-type H+-transporting ATPase subunit G/H